MDVWQIVRIQEKKIYYMKKHLLFLFAVMLAATTAWAQNPSRANVNGDDNVNTADVVAIYSYIEQGDASGITREAADVNGDDDVNTADVVMVYDIIINGDPFKTYTANGVKFNMIDVAGGTFQMGKSAMGSNIEPVHNVTLSPYSIGQTEVTQELWETVMGSNPSEHQGNNLPVTNVSWKECKHFASRLTALLADQLGGKEFRLPTEAEWEYAAKGGDKTKGYLYSGSDYADDVAWYYLPYDDSPCAVATKQANELGIYDMSGNVAEWCFDWSDAYSAEDQTDPIGPATGDARVIRGGYYSGDNYGIRTTYRLRATSPDVTIGLRLALGTPIGVAPEPVTYTVNGTEFKMVPVEGGSFTMGSNSGGSDARPAHGVTLSDYAIGQTEVTQALWKAVMGDGFVPGLIKGDDLPVQSVEKELRFKFIDKLNTLLADQLDGKEFRLPTEAEWEFAAIGGNLSKGYTYSGSNSLDDVAWFKGNSVEDNVVHPVATKQPNELGIYDMSGNVSEWCSDWYGDYSAEAQTNPAGPDKGEYKVLRGGSYRSEDGEYGECAVVSRVSTDFGLMLSSQGLRLVLGDKVNSAPEAVPFTINGAEFKMVPVYGGKFTMGNDNGGDYEQPAHEVTLDDYLIGQTEVTDDLWNAVMDGSPSGFNTPKGYVSWDDCQRFVSRLNTLLASQLDGKVFRLPTEAEWEFAARGGNDGKGYTYSGSNNLDDVAHYGEEYSEFSQPVLYDVATLQPNELGIYDMSGNVEEWCYDMFGEYEKEPQTNPTGVVIGEYHVVRGGSVISNEYGCRISTRGSGVYTDQNLGFRLVLGAEYSLPSYAYTEYEANGVKFDMVYVDNGTFYMGNDNGSANEKPAHQVTLSEYYIGKTEVTQQLWQAVMGSNPSRYVGEQNPVEEVSWNDCQTFIGKLNILLADQLDGKEFRLPTEAEWEFAARGGKKSKGYKYSGYDELYYVAWYRSGSSSIETKPVASKYPNELGIYDMTGNVCEWCLDWYGEYSADPIKDPTGPATGTQRVRRGGDAFSYYDECGVTYRESSVPTSVSNNFGLRLALVGKGNMPEVKYKELQYGDVKFNMVPVEGGTFEMGTATSGNNVKHEVTVNDYLISSTEVTQALWESVVGTNPSEVKGPDLPVTNVSWEECQTFLKELNRGYVDLPAGKVFRLPTEAEWEYAAKGGKKSRDYTYSGGNIQSSVAWDAFNSDSEPHSVATKWPNELGIYDMSGNVNEWCYDWYYAYNADAQYNPIGPKTAPGMSSSQRVVRGGSYASQGSQLKPTARTNNLPTSKSKYTGLRLVLGDYISQYKRFNADGITFYMVDVEGGTFEMGNEHGAPDEMPTNEVTLSDYSISETEVTVNLVRVISGQEPYTGSGQIGNLPITEDWPSKMNALQNFIQKLNKKYASMLNGKVFRLATEAEWEFAARGGLYSKGYTYSGSNNLDEVAWYKMEDDWQLRDVAQLKPNELGIYDMTGNACEICSDWYDEYYGEVVTNPTGPETGDKYVVRGGDFWGAFTNTQRDSVGVYSRRHALGLRLVIGENNAKPTPDLTTYTANGVAFNMVAVEGGTFTMGSNAGESNVRPAHQVTLSSYAIGQTEVTQELWEAVMGENPSTVTGDNLPVEHVNWDDCQEFVAKLNEQLASQLGDKVFRLPTEAEWEYAAKGGNKSVGCLYSGRNYIDDVAWYENNTDGQPRPVATKLPNELGIYDMSGNVEEWCYDWYGEYSGKSQTDPVCYTIIDGDAGHAVRGGSCWSYLASDCTTTARYGFGPSVYGGSRGLRLVLGNKIIDPTEQTFSVAGVQFNMTTVKGGTFTMGSNTGGSDTRPVHEVTLSDFVIGQTEVTQALWKAVMGENPNEEEDEDVGDKLPVTCVSWNDCQTFIDKLNLLLSSQLGDKEFRLPTEAQWEFAARGGNKSKGYTYSGSNNVGNVAWYKDNSNVLQPVATKQSNELGIYDMSGNAYEWCSDWYDQQYPAGPQTDPTGPAQAVVIDNKFYYKVMRGGSVENSEKFCNVTERIGWDKKLTKEYYGLRLALK